MSPKVLTAEGAVPGRPALRGKTIKVSPGYVLTGHEANKGAAARMPPGTSMDGAAHQEGVVKHEDPSGVVIEKADGVTLALAYPFDYEVVADA